eukprot:6039596-Amphidinium_carterae.1
MREQVAIEVGIVPCMFKCCPWCPVGTSPPTVATTLEKSASLLQHAEQDGLSKRCCSLRRKVQTVDVGLWVQSELTSRLRPTSTLELK